MYSKKYVSGFVKTTYNLECGAVWPICHAERESLSLVRVQLLLLFYSVPFRPVCRVDGCRPARRRGTEAEARQRQAGGE